MEPFKGFLYNEENHTYHLNGKEMTGVTTILKAGGGNDNLVQWASNNGSAEAFKIAWSMMATDRKRFTELVDLINTFPKIDYVATQELDKAFPEFKQARTKHTGIKNKAGGVGKDAHKIVELFEEGKPLDKTCYDEATVKRAEGYIKWYEENVAKTWFTERPVFSASLFVAGTPDGGIQMKKDGKNLIKDTKFKTGLYSPHPMWQMRGYDFLMAEMRADTTTPVRLEWKDGRVEEYKNPQEYLGSWGNVNWDGSVVIQVNEDGTVEPVFRYAGEQDLKSFLALVHIYRELQAFPKPKFKWAKKPIKTP